MIIITFPVGASWGDRPMLLKKDYWNLQALGLKAKGPLVSSLNPVSGVGSPEGALPSP